ncbi:MAG: hypothetical protein ACE5I3_11880 [Phycisphaerae bacterium]
MSDVVYVTTDDGSYGFKGTVADQLKVLMKEKERPIGAVYAAGPVPMMRAIAELTSSPTGPARTTTSSRSSPTPPATRSPSSAPDRPG